MALRVLNPRHTEGALTGRHVLAIFLGFFGLIFAVNGYFLFSALATHTGVVANEPYRKGLAYNERIAAGERQASLNWSDALSVSRDGRIVLALSKDGGGAVSGLTLEGRIGRPSTSKLDRALAFAQTPAGYTAEAGALAEGTWVIDIEAREGADLDPVYRLRRRIWLKQ